MFIANNIENDNDTGIYYTPGTFSVLTYYSRLHEAGAIFIIPILQRRM
jgi:hypothetical protein